MQGNDLDTPTFNGPADESLYLVLAVRLVSFTHLVVFPIIFAPQVSYIRILFNVKVRVQLGKILQ